MFLSDIAGSTVRVATEYAARPSSKLLNDNLDDIWTAYNQRSSGTWIEWESDIVAADRVIGLVGVLGTNRIAPTYPEASSAFRTLPSYWRVRAHTDPIRQSIRPGIMSASLTNLTGSPDILEAPLDAPEPFVDGASPEQTKLAKVSNSANTVLLATFDNHTTIPGYLQIDPAGTHTLRVYYQHSQADLTIPTLTTKLYQGGVAVPGGTLTANSSITEQVSYDDFGIIREGFILTYTFSSALIPVLDDPLQVQITGTHITTSTPEPVRVEWIVALTGYTYDSGWVEAGSAALTGDYFMHPDIPIPANTQLWIYIEFSDFAEVTVASYTGGSARTYSSITGEPGQNEKAFSAGRLVIAETVEIRADQVGGLNRRKSGDLPALRTRGGQPRGSRNPLSWTDYDFAAVLQSEDRVFEELESFFVGVGFDQPFWVSLNDDRGLWAMLTSWEQPHAGAQIGTGVQRSEEEREIEPTPLSMVETWDLAFSITEAAARTR